MAHTFLTTLRNLLISVITLLSVSAPSSRTLPYYHNLSSPALEIYRKTGQSVSPVSTLLPKRMIKAAAEIILDARRLDAVIRGKPAENNPLRINMPLVNHADAIALINQVKSETPGRASLIGSLEGEAGSEVVLVIQSGYLAGYISLPGYRYQILPSQPGSALLLEIDPSGFPDELPPLIPQYSQNSEFSNPINQTQALGDDDGSRIDLLVVYDQAVQDEIGKDPGIQAWIEAAVEVTNLSFAHSQVNQRLTLVGTRLVAYDETIFNWIDVLNQLKNPSDGFLDEVQPLRDTLSADVVIMLVASYDSICGLSEQMDHNNFNTFADKAFGVVYWNCVLGNYSLSHELGHLMGSQNDQQNASNAHGVYNYSFGYQDPGANFRTIMAEKLGCGDNTAACPRINYWSNPAVYYNNLPTGVNSDDPKVAANNAKSLNLTAQVVANFRDGPAPNAPDQLKAATDYTDPIHPVIHLSWADNSGDETEFQIERALHGDINWSRLLSVAPNTTSSLDANLTVNQAYDYRIRAHSGNGNSIYSNIATGSTLLAPETPANLSAVTLSEDQIALSWHLPAVDTTTHGDAENLMIERKTGDDPAWLPMATIKANATQYTDLNLFCETPYQYRLKAVNSAGESPYSAIASSQTEKCTDPSAPESLTALATSPVEVTLRWSTGLYATTYKIERSVGNMASWDEIPQIDGAITQSIDKGLIPGASYAYRIRSCNPHGDSGYSPIAHVEMPWYTNYLPISMDR